jgi:hypothetical protein
VQELRRRTSSWEDGESYEASLDPCESAQKVRGALPQVSSAE